MWKAVSALPVEELTRIDEKYIGKYHASVNQEVKDPGQH
jgi:vacuolar-type H+-ATPase subunit B/Vma2